MTLSFVLASQSPRRRQLLGLLGAPIRVEVSGANEDVSDDDDPVTYVADVARRKAEIIARQISFHPAARTIILAADTTVVLDGAILGKPATAAEARDMLQQLRGRKHDVHTGLCVIDPSAISEVVEVQTSAVTMRPYSDQEIEDYIATGDPLDKAGAYGIQHSQFRPVSVLDGCFLGVMGLSLCHLLDVFRRTDVPVSMDLDLLRAAHEGFPCPLLEQLAVDQR